MANLVGQGQLRHLWRHSTVVVHEGNDARVEGSLGALVLPPDRLRVGLVLLANAAGSTRGTCHPRQAQSAAREVSVNKPEIF